MVEQWEAAEKSAADNRQLDVTAMDIYDIQAVKGLYSTQYPAHEKSTDRTVSSRESPGSLTTFDR